MFVKDISLILQTHYALIINMISTEWLLTHMFLL